MKGKKKDITKEEALSRLESLCSRSEQCEYELNQKLYRWGLNVNERKEIISSLEENRYLDNARYARSYANDKARFSSWGPIKIRTELMRRHISSSLITEALKSVDQEIWKEGIMKCARTKARSLDLTEDNFHEKRQKLFRYLLTRGFPMDTSRKVVNKMISEEIGEENEELS